MARLRWTLRRLRDVGRGRGTLLIEALAWLLLARLALVFVPFPRLAGRLGTFVSPGDARAIAAKAAGTAVQADIAAQVGWAVTRAARHAPFAAVCLPQAMAARIMLTRRGTPSVLHFGVRNTLEQTLDKTPELPALASLSSKDRINAHAWLDAAGVEVTGYPEATRMATIACFV